MKDAEKVMAYMSGLSHPLKAALEELRRIILEADRRISERIKWNAPSYYYKVDMAAFNLRAQQFIHLILIYPGGKNIPVNVNLLEGAHKDRREVKFYSMDDVKAKKAALEKVVTDWVEYIDT